MKLYELLAGVSFDSLIPTLERIVGEDTTAECGCRTACFKQAFDELRLIVPKINDETIRVERYGEEMDNGESVCVCNCAGDYWDSNLGKTIHVAEDCSGLTPEETAAHILWEITFFGFSSTPEPLDDRDKFCKFGPNVYADKLAMLQDRMADNYSRQRGKASGESGETAEEFFASLKRSERRNRAKRMRDHRQELLEARLERMAKVQTQINEICSLTDGIGRDELDYLFGTAQITADHFRSQVKDDSERTDYVLDLLENYSGSDYSSCDSLVCLTVSDTLSPLSEEEKGKVASCIERVKPFSRLCYGNATRKDFGKGVELILVGSVDRKPGVKLTSRRSYSL